MFNEVGNDLGVWKKRIAQAFFALLALGSVYLLVLVFVGLKEWRGPNPIQNSITVSGHGEAIAIPDTASFSFSVTEEAPMVAEAQRLVNNKMEKVSKVLKDEGIGEGDVKTTSYNIYPKYEYSNYVCNQGACPPYREPKIIGYEVSQTTTVKVRESEKAGDLLSKVGASEVKNMSGLTFSVDKEEDIKAEARAKAVADAREKAEKLAKALGVRLSRVVSFYENEGGDYPRFYAEKSMGFGGDAVAAPAPASVSAGENQYISNVSVTFEIR